MTSSQASRGVATRRAVVDAALRVFADKGYRAGALAEVAERCGLTPAGILYHFGSKKALLLEVIAERDRRAGSLFASWPGEGIASLRDIVAVAELCEREPGLAALHTVLQVESFDPAAPAHAYFRDRGRFLRHALRELFEACQASGEVRADLDCAAKADEVLAFLEGAAVVWLMDRDGTSLVRLYSNYLDGLVASVQNRPAVSDGSAGASGAGTSGSEPSKDRPIR